MSHSGLQFLQQGEVGIGYIQSLFHLLSKDFEDIYIFGIGHILAYCFL